jgi:divalent metal cation (Fe/Co/Zn/Cd) transporter
MYIHWAAMDRSPDAIGAAARHDLSPFRIARPYNRWGVDVRCDIWTLCGAFIGVLLGLGLGWAMLDSLPLGILLAGAGALITGWHYRVVASLLAVARHARSAAEEPRRAEHPE